MSYRVLALFLILTTIASLILIIPNTNSASACMCAPRLAPIEELQRSTAVFSAKTVDINESKSGNGYDIKFDVERVWKGTFDDIAVIFTPSSGDLCGYEFEEGEKYLVYAYKSDGPLHTSICNRTTPLADAQEDLEFLDTAWLVYKLKFEDQVFKIPYRITDVNLRWMEIDPDFGSIIIRTASDNDGMLELTIPRNLIDPREADGQDAEFIVVVEPEVRKIKEIGKSVCFRTILIDIPGGTEEIEIIGLSVPEGIQSADVPPVYVSTDKTYYSQGELVMISGCTNLTLNANEVILEARNPEEKIYRIMSIRPSATGEFSTSMIIRGELAVNGTYTVKARYAGEGTASTFVVPEFPVSLIILGISFVGFLVAARRFSSTNKHNVY